MSNNLKNFLFFGTDSFATTVLEELKKLGINPRLIITLPDKPQGRNLVLTPPPVKIWAQYNNIKYLQPEKLSGELLNQLTDLYSQLFIVASYGKIIPKQILDLPAHGTLNIHPSLLPKYRGPSPIQTAILNDDKDTGVTIILLDEKIDHGDIVASRKVEVSDWPPKAYDLEKILAVEGADLLMEIIPKWITKDITPAVQEHSKATFTKKIEKKEGEITLSADPYQNLLKIKAYNEWPGAYYFIERKGKKIRVLIKDAKFENNKLIIMRVLPEGGKEIDYSDFIKGL